MKNIISKHSIALITLLITFFTLIANQISELPPTTGCFKSVTLSDPSAPPTTITSINAGPNTTNPPMMCDPNAKVYINGTEYNLPLRVSAVFDQVNKLTTCVSPFIAFCCYQVMENPLGSGIFKVVEICYKRP